MSFILPQDDNNRPVFNPDVGIVVKKSVTFDGGTADAIGNDGGAQDPYTAFNISGLVLGRLFAHCTDSLAGASATLAITPYLSNGSGNYTYTGAVTATSIDLGHIVFDNSPANGYAITDVPQDFYAEGSIRLVVGTANITSGAIDLYMMYYPIEDGATVTPA